MTLFEEEEDELIHSEQGRRTIHNLTIQNDFSWRKKKLKVRFYPSKMNNLVVIASSVVIVALSLSLVGCVQGAATTGGAPFNRDSSRNFNSDSSNFLSLTLSASDIVPSGKTCENVMSNLDKVLASQQTYYSNGAAINEDAVNHHNNSSSTSSAQFSSSSSSTKLICSNSNNKQANSSTASCCPTKLIPTLLHSQSSNLLLQTFNNSFKYNTFKTQITAHVKVIEKYESSNKELWNATIDGLNVLKEWGVKYWDPLYLYKNRVFSNECLSRVVGNWVCYTCEGGSEARTVKPCKSLCHNTVTGCLKAPLAEYIEKEWKHAVNSVRTAVRLVMTTGGGSVLDGDRKESQADQPLQELVNDLNDWREPITWWLDEYKSSRACEGLPSDGCWNGESVGRYDNPTATWRTNYNPEFDNAGASRIDPVVTVELDKFRNQLVFVRRTLEKFWPTASPHQIRSPHALPLSSMEDHTRPRLSSSPHQDLISYEGSGGFDSDDEDEFGPNSGNGPIGGDDEDYVDGYGSGSGDGPGETDESDINIESTGNNDISTRKDVGPISLNSGRKVQYSATLGGIIILFNFLLSIS